MSDDIAKKSAARVLFELARRYAGQTGYNLANDAPVLTDDEFIALGFAVGVLIRNSKEQES